MARKQKLGEVEVKFTADTTEVQSAMEDVKRDAENTASGVEQSSQRVEKSSSAASSALSAVLSILQVVTKAWLIYGLATGRAAKATVAAAATIKKAVLPFAALAAAVLSVVFAIKQFIAALKESRAELRERTADTREYSREIEALTSKIRSLRGESGDAIAAENLGAEASRRIEELQEKLFDRERGLFGSKKLKDAQVRVGALAAQLTSLGVKDRFNIIAKVERENSQIRGQILLYEQLEREAKEARFKGLKGSFEDMADALSVGTLNEEQTIARQAAKQIEALRELKQQVDDEFGEGFGLGERFDEVASLINNRAEADAMAIRKRAKFARDTAKAEALQTVRELEQQNLSPVSKLMEEEKESIRALRIELASAGIFDPSVYQRGIDAIKETTKGLIKEIEDAESESERRKHEQRMKNVSTYREALLGVYRDAEQAAQQSIDSALGDVNGMASHIKRIAQDLQGIRDQGRVL